MANFVTTVGISDKDRKVALAFVRTERTLFDSTRMWTMDVQEARRVADALNEMADKLDPKG